MKNCMNMDASHSAFSQELTNFPTPMLPYGFMAAREPVPLIGVQDAWWVVFVYNQIDDLNGLLIFEDKKAIIFLSVEEAITFSALVLEQLPKLLHHCAPDYLKSSLHTDGVKLLRSAWWSKEAEKTRTLSGCLKSE